MGAFQGLVLTVFLFSKKTNGTANRLLGLLNLFWGINLVLFGLQSQGFFREFPHLLKTFTHLQFTFFPLLYLYVKYLLSAQYSFKKKDWLHFIPMLINVFLYTDFYFQSGDEKIQIVLANEGYFNVVSIISDEALSLQGIIYPIFILVMLRNYQINIVDYQSYINRRDLKLLRAGVVLSLISWVFGIIAFHLEAINISIGFDLFIICYLLIVGIIYAISYIAMFSPEVFKLNESQVISFRSESNKGKTPADTHEVSIDKEEKLSVELHNQLLKYMEEEKPYLNPELSLQGLADQLCMSRHQLSALINQGRKMNFYEFVNSYRIDEFKLLIQQAEKKHLKMVTVAFEAGFNSKASFNRIFKQMTGQTPSEFRLTIESDS